MGFAWGGALAAQPAGAGLGLSKKDLALSRLSGLATGCPWLCDFRALQLGGAPKVAPIDKRSVVFVLIIAARFMGESLTWKTALGRTVITAGAVVLAWR